MLDWVCDGAQDLRKWDYYQLTCSVCLLWWADSKLIQFLQVWLCVGRDHQPCLRSAQSQQTKPWSCVDTHVLCKVANSYEVTPSAFTTWKFPFLQPAKSRNVWSLVVEQHSHTKLDCHDKLLCRLALFGVYSTGTVYPKLNVRHHLTVQNDITDLWDFLRLLHFDLTSCSVCWHEPLNVDACRVMLQHAYAHVTSQ